MAGMLYGVPIRGTHAHSFVSSFNPDEEKLIGKLQPKDKSKPPKDFYPETGKWLKKLSPVLKVVESETNVGERIGFSAYATAFPTSFLALVDTYNVLRYYEPNPNMNPKYSTDTHGRYLFFFIAKEWTSKLLCCGIDSS